MDQDEHGTAKASLRLQTEENDVTLLSAGPFLTLRFPYSPSTSSVSMETVAFSLLTHADTAASTAEIARRSVS